MAYVVTEKCINCKYTECVESCPVDCFYEGPNFMTINPDECIDCGKCQYECPVEAIYAADDLPMEYKPFIALNANYSKQWKSINVSKPPLPDAEKWAQVPDKLALLAKNGQEFD